MSTPFGRESYSGFDWLGSGDARIPRFMQPGGIREVIDRMREAERRREILRGVPRPPKPPPPSIPLLVVGVLLPGLFEDVLPPALAGLVPTPRVQSNSAVRYLRVDDSDLAGRTRLRALVHAGFSAFAQSGVLRRLAACEALVADDLFAAGGVTEEDQPCIAYYTTHHSAPVALLHLPASTWCDKPKLKRLRAILQTDLGSRHLLKLWTDRPEPRSTAAFSTEVARHIKYIEKRLIGPRPAGATTDSSGDKRQPTRPRTYLPALRDGFATLRELETEFGIAHSSANRLVHKVPGTSKKFVKRRLVVERTAFMKVLYEDGRLPSFESPRNRRRRAPPRENLGRDGTRRNGMDTDLD